MATIETGHTEIPESYNHLFELDTYLEKTKGQRVEDMLLQAFKEDRHLLFGRKITLIESRAMTQMDHDRTSENKAKAYREIMGSIFGACSAALSVGAAFAGGMNSLPGGIFSALARTLDTSADTHGKGIQAKQVGNEHTYTLMSQTISTYTNELQKSDQSQQKTFSDMERITSKSDRVFEIASQAAGG